VISSSRFLPARNPLFFLFALVDLVLEILFRETRRKTRFSVSSVPRFFESSLSGLPSLSRSSISPSLLRRHQEPSSSTIITANSSSNSGSDTRKTRTLAPFYTLLSRGKDLASSPTFLSPLALPHRVRGSRLSLLIQIFPRKLAAETFEPRYSLQPTCRLLGHQRDGPSCYGRPRRVREIRGALSPLSVAMSNFGDIFIFFNIP